jgi:hypothetical protein
MTPQDVFTKLDSVLRPQHGDIVFNPSGICSRTLQVPFKDGSGLSYNLTLFIDVSMAPTTGEATGIVVSHPPNHNWKGTPEDITASSTNLTALFDLIKELGNEYLNRERQTVKVLNNRELGEQLARLCKVYGSEDVSSTSERFTLKKGSSTVKVRIVEDTSQSPNASVSMVVSGVENKVLLNALKMLL